MKMRSILLLAFGITFISQTYGKQKQEKKARSESTKFAEDFDDGDAFCTIKGNQISSAYHQKLKKIANKVDGLSNSAEKTNKRNHIANALKMTANITNLEKERDKNCKLYEKLPTLFSEINVGDDLAVHLKESNKNSQANKKIGQALITNIISLNDQIKAETLEIENKIRMLKEYEL